MRASWRSMPPASRSPITICSCSWRTWSSACGRRRPGSRPARAPPGTGLGRAQPITGLWVTVRRRGPGRQRWRSAAKARRGLRMPAGRGQTLFVARACVLLPGHRVQPSTSGRRLHEALEELSDSANEQARAAPALPPDARSIWPRDCVFHLSILPPGIRRRPWPQARRAPNAATRHVSPGWRPTILSAGSGSAAYSSFTATYLLSQDSSVRGAIFGA